MGATVLAALISALGTLFGALGAIALTGGLDARRQDRAAAAVAASERAAARERTCTGLLAALTGLRIDIELACARHWQDMNVRLAVIQEQATAIGVLASQVAPVSSGQEAETAFALSTCASRLTAWTAKSVLLSNDFAGPGGQYVAGQIPVQPDFAELDALVATFLSLVSPGAAAMPPPHPGSPQSDQPRGRLG
jgi:hypothetical protein